MAFPIAWILNELGQKMYAWASTKSVMDFDRGGKNGQTLQKTLNDLFSSVSEGKSLIAAAVTEKGVETAADSTFQEMAENIQGISINSDQWISIPANQLPQTVTNSPNITFYAVPASVPSYLNVPLKENDEGVEVLCQNEGGAWIVGLFSRDEKILCETGTIEFHSKSDNSMTIKINYLLQNSLVYYRTIKMPNIANN